MAHVANESGIVNCATYAGGVRAEVSIDVIDALLQQRDRFVWLGPRATASRIANG